MEPKALKAKLFLSVGLLLISLAGKPANAQDTEIAKYPSRPINLIVPMPAGGATDMAFRLISKEAEKFLGQSIVVVNKPGGGGTIGTAALAGAKPDGYNIGYAGHSAMYVIPHFEKVPYHPTKDIKGIMQFGALNFGIYVKGGSPFPTFQDLVAYARQNPKKITYGTIGPNSFQFLVTEEIAKKEKIQFTHIPFKGAPEVQTAVLGGHLIFGVSDLNYSMIEAGQIKLLLVLREERCLEYPQTPILNDLGYRIPAPTILNISGPKNLPAEVVKKLEDAFTRAMKEPAFVKGMNDLRLPIVHRNSNGLDDYFVHNYELFGKFIKEK